MYPKEGTNMTRLGHVTLGCGLEKTMAKTFEGPVTSSVICYSVLMS